MCQLETNCLTKVVAPGFRPELYSDPLRQVDQ